MITPAAQIPSLDHFKVQWQRVGQVRTQQPPAVHNTLFKYDANGNIERSGDRTVAWTAFNKPKRIQRNHANGSVTGFTMEYDAEFNRIFRRDYNNTETVYIDKDYEQITENAKAQHRYYVQAGDSTVQVTLKGTNAQTKETRYMLTDHLGSTNVITNGAGEVVQRLAFDPWGMRTKTDNGIIPVNKITNRGYTGHEMHDNVGLTNMNARIYDPYIGRFLSPDTIIPNAADMQQYNRYSYVGNNPLGFVDPTGNMGCAVTTCVISNTVPGDVNAPTICYSCITGDQLANGGVGIPGTGNVYDGFINSNEVVDTDDGGFEDGSNDYGASGVAVSNIPFAVIDARLNQTFGGRGNTGVYADIATPYRGANLKTPSYAQGLPIIIRIRAAEERAAIAAANETSSKVRGGRTRTNFQAYIDRSLAGLQGGVSLDGFLGSLDALGGIGSVVTGTAKVGSLLGSRVSSFFATKGGTNLGSKLFSNNKITGFASDNVIKKGNSLIFENFSVQSLNGGKDLIGPAKQLLQFANQNGVKNIRLQGSFIDVGLQARFGGSATFDISLPATRAGILEGLRALK